ncbi:MAG TPA: thiamine diphosphokinase [bacterium]|nr:thiamine diphosphokinase [bacterium]HPN44581.1 thiamine diphosphokinase [bacterium]
MSRVIIFANGIAGDIEKNRRYISNGDHIVCADGGTRYALAMGLRPDLIVGDLDSLDAELLNQVQELGIPVERHPADKCETDLELAIQAAHRFEAEEVLILTALGGRMDQFLANIMLLTRQDWSFHLLCIADGDQQGWILTGPAKKQLTGKPGDILSIVPVSERIEHLDISGVRWSLTDAVVERGSTLTLSNVMAGKDAQVKFSRGICLLVHIEGAVFTE